jgi:hypothetical protein
MSIEDKAPLRGGRVDGIMQAFKAHAFLHERRDDLHQVFEGAPQPVELPDDDDIAFPHLREQPVEFFACGLGTAGSFRVDRLTAGAPEGVELQIKVLLFGTDTGITDVRALINTSDSFGWEVAA